MPNDRILSILTEFQMPELHYQSTSNKHPSPPSFDSFLLLELCSLGLMEEERPGGFYGEFLLAPGMSHSHAQVLFWSLKAMK